MSFITAWNQAMSFILPGIKHEFHTSWNQDMSFVTSPATYINKPTILASRLTCTSFRDGNSSITAVATAAPAPINQPKRAVAIKAADTRVVIEEDNDQQKVQVQVQRERVNVAVVEGADGSYHYEEEWIWSNIKYCLKKVATYQPSTAVKAIDCCCQAVTCNPFDVCKKAKSLK